MQFNLMEAKKAFSKLLQSIEPNNGLGNMLRFCHHSRRVKQVFIHMGHGDQGSWNENLEFFNCFWNRIEPADYWQKKFSNYFRHKREQLLNPVRGCTTWTALLGYSYEFCNIAHWFSQALASASMFFLEGGKNFHEWTHLNVCSDLSGYLMTPPGCGRYRRRSLRHGDWCHEQARN